MKTVHLIFNAHLDPIWLWPGSRAWTNCSTHAGRLAIYWKNIPTSFFPAAKHGYIGKSRGSIELVFPDSKAGQAGAMGNRGRLVDSAGLQSTSGFAMERQIAMGKEYFISRFGFFPDIAYNVDSFGHAATLPVIWLRPVRNIM